MSRSAPVEKERYLPQCLYHGPVQEDPLFATCVPITLSPQNGVCQGENDNYYN